MNLLNLELTIDEANLVLKGLNELPYKESNNLIQKIVQEAEKQLKPAVSSKPT